MPKFIDFFIFDFKRFMCKRNLIALSLVLILLFYAVHRGTGKYKKTMLDGKEFQKTESLTFSRLSNYTEYSKRGIMVLFIPSAPVIFFTNPVLFSVLFSYMVPIKIILLK